MGFKFLRKIGGRRRNIFSSADNDKHRSTNHRIDILLFTRSPPFIYSQRVYINPFWTVSNRMHTLYSLFASRRYLSLYVAQNNEDTICGGKMMEWKQSMNRNDSCYFSIHSICFDDSIPLCGTSNVRDKCLHNYCWNNCKFETRKMENCPKFQTEITSQERILSWWIDLNCTKV